MICEPIVIMVYDDIDASILDEEKDYNKYFIVIPIIMKIWMTFNILQNYQFQIGLETASFCKVEYLKCIAVIVIFAG